MRFARWSLWFGAVVFLGLGFLVVADPSTLSVSSGIEIPTPVARLEVRSGGGLYIGIGLFFAMAARQDGLLRIGLVAQLAMMAGLVIGRIIGIFVDGSPGMFSVFWLGLESLMCVVALIALSGLKKTT